MTKKMRNKRSSFLIEYLLKNEPIPACYLEVQNSIAPQVYFNTEKISTHLENASFINIYDIPSYYKPILNSQLNTYKKLIAPLYAGYAINLSAYTNFQDYINKIVRRARWSQLKRYKKRLDLCLQPTYKTYYGTNLEIEEYNKLFETLYVITEERFKQKEEFNFEIPYLKLYQEIMYPLILDKKAAIFVIYHQDRPINITLNFINGNTFFHWNSCYDTKYAMFNLGHINVTNHLEWCFNNNMKLFDMGRGDFLHKRKWVDTTYVYNEHVVFKSSNLKAIFSAYYKFCYISLRYYSIGFLKRINFHKLYSTFIHAKYRWFTKNEVAINNKQIEITNNKNQPNNVNLTPINPLNKTHEALLEPLNYFLHKNQEQFSNVKVYSINNNLNHFYMEGKNNSCTVKC